MKLTQHFYGTNATRLSVLLKMTTHGPHSGRQSSVEVPYCGEHDVVWDPLPHARARPRLRWSMTQYSSEALSRPRSAALTTVSSLAGSGQATRGPLFLGDEAQAVVLAPLLSLTKVSIYTGRSDV